MYVCSMHNCRGTEIGLGRQGDPEKSVSTESTVGKERTSMKKNRAEAFGVRGLRGERNPSVTRVGFWVWQAGPNAKLIRRNGII